MKRKTIYTLLATTVALFTLFGTATAQVNYMEQIAIENPTISKDADITSVNFDIILNNLKLNKNDMLIITPVIVSESNEVKLSPVAVKGKLRNKILARPFGWKGKTRLEFPVEDQIVRRNGTAQSVHFAATLLFEEWQRKAQLVLKTVVIGCADCSEVQPDKLISQKILPDLFIPTYRVTYIVPEAEPVKQRSETYSAHLNYKVGRHDLLPDFQNNAVELAKVGKIIRELKNDPDLTITNFIISGYASPEGKYDQNMQLSRRRAESFAQYMEKEYAYSRNQFKVQWFGEDWDGLKKAVVGSNLANKDAIVKIIDDVSDHDARDGRLIALDNRQTYNRLLNDFYPPLRRNDYTVSFVSRPFNVDEAKEVIKTRPKLLSLNEMFLVAQTYAPASSEFKEVFDIAARLYPNEPIAILNSAAADIEGGNNQSAIDRLNKIESDQRVWNNLGVAYARSGGLEKAKGYFEKATARGDEDAKHNLEELKKTMENR